MRGPRRIRITKEEVAKYALSTVKPSKNSLFAKMWDTCKPISEKTLTTDFVKGIGTGTLDPVKFGAFNVSDAYYCFNGEKSYLTAENKAKNEILKIFLAKKYEGYKEYNATFPKVWRVKDASGVVPLKVSKEYSEYERHIVNTEDPIYVIPLMLPCETLWPWLASQMTEAERKDNLYASWVGENIDASGAYAMGNFLELYMKAHPEAVCEKKATEIYSKAMEFEYLNFEHATK